MKNMWKVGMTSLALVASLGLAACSNNNEDNMSSMDHSQMNQDETDTDTNNSGTSMSGMQGTAPTEFNTNATAGLVTLNTKNITRISSSDPITFAVTVSQTIWPATHQENQPGAVILVPTGEWQIDVASADLIHHPNNGPILYTNQDSIPEATLKEIQRLNPTGTEDGTQVMVMGDVSDVVVSALKDYKVKQVTGTDAATFAKEVDKVYADAAGSYPESVIIGSSDDAAKLYTLPAVNWIAHMPEPLLYVTKDQVPQATIDALKERKNKANIYIVGPESVVSADVEQELKEYGTVTRISGTNPVENSIAFAKFKDDKTGFGWGLTQPGHGVSFASTNTPELIIAGAPFSHLGKHAPVILLDQGEPTQPVYDFLATLKPMFEETPTEGPYNHGFLLGTENDISFKTQGILDDQLEITAASGEDHSGH